MDVASKRRQTSNFFALFRLFLAILADCILHFSVVHTHRRAVIHDLPERHALIAQTAAAFLKLSVTVFIKLLDFRFSFQILLGHVLPKHKL